MKPFSPDLSLEAERLAVTEFIAPRWTPIEGLDQVVLIVQEAAFHDGRAAVDGLQSARFISELIQRRKAVLEGLFDDPIEKELAPGFDALIKSLIEMSMSVSTYAEVGLDIDGKWNYEKRSKAAQRLAESKCPGLVGARPIGWDEAVKQGCAPSGQTDGQKPFEGSSVDLTRSLPLPRQLSLNNLIYGSQDQGYPVGYALISAIYSHFSHIQEKLVTHQIKLAIDQLAAWDEPALVFTAPERTQTPHRLLGLMLEQEVELVSMESFREAVAARIAFDAMPEEDRKATMQQNREEALRSMKAMMANFDADERQKKGECLAKLKQAFSVQPLAHDIDHPGL